MRRMEWLFYVVALGLQELDESDPIMGLLVSHRADLELHALRMSLQLTHTRVEAIFSQCTACDFLSSHRHSLVLRLFP